MVYGYGEVTDFKIKKMDTTNITLPIKFTIVNSTSADMLKVPLQVIKLCTQNTKKISISYKVEIFGRFIKSIYIPVIKDVISVDCPFNFDNSLLGGISNLFV